MVPDVIKNEITLLNGLWDMARKAPFVSAIAALAPNMVTLASDVVVSALAGWHGYGWYQDENGFVFTLFVEKPTDLDPVRINVKKLLPHIEVEAMVVPQFKQMGSAPQKPVDIILQPGKAVSAASDSKDCRFACTGTIGGFLTGKQADGKQVAWLLSNHHILAECTTAISKAFDANNTTIGADIRRVPPKDDVFLVDAAVVKINVPSKINPIYEGLEPPLTNPVESAPPQLNSGDIVQKLGSATNVTSGSFAFHCPRVTVFHCSMPGSEVYVDQLSFTSIQGKNPFAEEGDSGSLVVKRENPVGLLFAKTVKEADPTVADGQKFKPPFFLANPWDVVIQQVSGLVNAPLELMLQEVNAPVG